MDEFSLLLFRYNYISIIEIKIGISTNDAREVTIVVLIILAGITLNAVIGEGGIIFQARDTRNKISNETTYDNAQLAQLQNELKDNGLYSGIGIIPGTDNGGGSEGGENGTSGSTNTGGNPNVGKDAETPNIVVLSGEELAEGIYQSDITVQILNGDKTQKIKYVLATTVDEINKELYPSGLKKELEIENGGTLTFTKAGEYTITAYAYDTKGNKSEARSKKIKRLEGEKGIPNPPIFTASGIMGEPGYYSSDVVIKVEAETFTEIEKITYVVTGQAKTVGKIGNKDVAAGENILAEEVEIENEETFEITADGIWTIKGYTYDTTGKKSEIAKGIIVAKDTIAPVAGVPVVSSGERGEPGYYRSDVTVKIQGYDDIGLKKVTYVVTGETKSSGAIGEIPVGNNQSVNTGEIEIENNGTFTITADGIYNITAYSYDKVENKSAVSETLTVTRDTVPPVIESFEKIAENDSSVTVRVIAKDDQSGLASVNAYAFFQNEGRGLSGLSNAFTYQNLENKTTYNFYATIRDKSGNEIRTITLSHSAQSEKSKYNYYLVDKVTIGDLVNYDCGNWPSAPGDNWLSGRPFGYSEGKPKCYGGENDKVYGWFVVGIEGSGANGWIEISPVANVCCYKCINTTLTKQRTEFMDFLRFSFDDGEFFDDVRLPSSSGNDREVMSNIRKKYLVSGEIDTAEDTTSSNVRQPVEWVFTQYGSISNSLSPDAEKWKACPIVKLRSGIMTTKYPDVTCGERLGWGLGY